MAAQVASGIGFTGAGTIIFRREVVIGATTAASIWAVAAVGLAVAGMFLAAVGPPGLALALLVLAKPLKARMFPNRKEARRVRLTREWDPPGRAQRGVEASEVPLERIVVRPSSAEEDDAELVLGKGSQEEELLSLMDGLRRVSGVREVSSALWTVRRSRSPSSSLGLSCPFNGVHGRDPLRTSPVRSSKLSDLKVICSCITDSVAEGWLRGPYRCTNNPLTIFFRSKVHRSPHS